MGYRLKNEMTRQTERNESRTAAGGRGHLNKCLPGLGEETMWKRLLQVGPFGVGSLSAAELGDPNIAGT